VTCNYIPAIIFKRTLVAGETEHGISADSMRIQSNDRGFEYEAQLNYHNLKQQQQQQQQQQLNTSHGSQLIVQL
jgi:hypothetical protein